MSRSKPEVVVITGASAGIGRATVRKFAEHGAYIGLVARGRDGLEGARKEVEAAGGKALETFREHLSCTLGISVCQSG